MLTDYIQAAMRHAKYEILEDGTYYGEIPPCPGVITNADNLEECRTTSDNAGSTALIQVASINLCESNPSKSPSRTNIPVI